MKLSFYWGAFDIKLLIGEKMVSTKFWWGRRPCGVGTWRLGCPALTQGRPEHHLALGRLHYARQTPASPGARAAPIRGADPSAMWRLGLGKRLDWLWWPNCHVAQGQPKRHMVLPIVIIILLLIIKIVLFIPQLIISLVFILLIINKIIIFIAQIILFFI